MFPYGYVPTSSLRATGKRTHGWEPVSVFLPERPAAVPTNRLAAIGGACPLASSSRMCWTPSSTARATSGSPRLPACSSDPLGGRTNSVADKRLRLPPAYRPDNPSPHMNRIAARSRCREFGPRLRPAPCPNALGISGTRENHPTSGLRRRAVCPKGFAPAHRASKVETGSVRTIAWVRLTCLAGSRVY